MSGKGGVGKTTLAAALGLLAAKHGLRTLIAEVDGKRALSNIFDAEGLTHAPARLANDLYGMSISVERSLEEYLATNLRLGRMARPLVSSQLLDFVAYAAPGLRDIIVLGKVWHTSVRDRAFDLIILDTAATGHALSMLRSPSGFLQAVPVGPIASQARSIVTWLQDPNQVSVLLAALAEETPANEVIETAGLLERHLGIDVAAVIVNMVFPPLLETAFDAPKLNDPALNFYEARRSMQQEHCDSIATALGKTATITQTPRVFERLIKQESAIQISEVIEAALK